MVAELTEVLFHTAMADEAACSIIASVFLTLSNCFSDSFVL